MNLFFVIRLEKITLHLNRIDFQILFINNNLPQLRSVFKEKIEYSIIIYRRTASILSANRGKLSSPASSPPNPFSFFPLAFLPFPDIFSP